MQSLPARSSLMRGLRLFLSSLWLKLTTFNSSSVSLCGRTGIQFRSRWSVWCRCAQKSCSQMSEPDRGFTEANPCFQNNPRLHDYILWSWHRNWTAGWESYSVTISKASNASFPPSSSVQDIRVRSFLLFHIQRLWTVPTEFVPDCPVFVATPLLRYQPRRADTKKGGLKTQQTADWSIKAVRVCCSDVGFPNSPFLALFFLSVSRMLFSNTQITDNSCTIIGRNTGKVWKGILKRTIINRLYF